mmetsp:Transcript_1680/g.3916  ORF Transcript_1680/g.3916 Transcript_1680/m.3916 type:complete len:97 (-) Transcript_1680:227-517(-)
MSLSRSLVSPTTSVCCFPSGDAPDVDEGFVVAVVVRVARRICLRKKGSEQGVTAMRCECMYVFWGQVAVAVVRLPSGHERKQRRLRSLPCVLPGKE